jgi:hypothetical protein
VLEAPGYTTFNVRVSADGIAYLNPRPLVTPTEPLEGQVVRPRMRPLDVQAQVSVALAGTGWRCELSDKGLYREQSAERFGGLASSLLPFEIPRGMARYSVSLRRQPVS